MAMKHLVTYKAISGVMGPGDEYTVITEHPMHLAVGVKDFIQEKATKHGFKTVDMSKLEERRIVIVYTQELNRP